MKNTFFGLLAALFLVPALTKGQDNGSEGTSSRNFFYVSPVDLFLNSLELGYEREMANKNTIVLLGGVKLSKKDNYYDHTGGAGEFQYRINLHYKNEALLPGQKNYRTFAYFAPYVNYRYEQITYALGSEVPATSTASTLVNSGFAGVGFGFRLMAKESRFCANFFAGGGMKFADVNGLRKYDDFLQPGYTGISPKVSFQLGIRF